MQTKMLILIFARHINFVIQAICSNILDLVQKQ